MDLFDRLHIAGFGERVSERVRGLSAALRGRAGKRIFGALLIVAAILCGKWAHDLSESEALHRFLLSRIPSLRVWRSSLALYGWTQDGDPKRSGKVARTLPASVDSAGTTWIGGDREEDPNWIAVYQGESSGLPPLLFCRDCKALPRHWQPVGISWEAFDQVMAKLDKIPKKIQTAERKAAFADPREIRY